MPLSSTANKSLPTRRSAILPDGGEGMGNGVGVSGGVGVGGIGVALPKVIFLNSILLSSFDSSMLLSLSTVNIKYTSPLAMSLGQSILLVYLYVSPAFRSKTLPRNLPKPISFSTV